MDEFGAPPAEEDFTSIPLEDRCVHKNWKARQSAYLELIQKFGKTASDEDPFFRPYLNGDLLKKWVTDSNAVAQEKGVDAVCALLKDSGENAARTRPDVLPSLVDKCLGSTRAGTKRAAIELAMLYIEVENAGDGVITDLLRGLEAKQPKLVASTVTALKQIVTEFGVKPLGDIKPLVKALNKIFAHSDKTVRAEGTGLTLALYSFLGPALLPSLQDLKPVQLKELTEAFNAMDASGHPGGSGKPTRFTRKQAREMEAAAGAGGGEDGGDAEPEAEQMDALDFLEAVDIVPLLPANFHEQIASPKWKDKVELLTDCLKILEGKSKIVDNPEISSYASALAAKMKDVNVLVVSNSAAMIAALARGVENKGFGKYRSTVMPPILDRLKEKKTADALGNSLDAVFSSTTFSDIVEDCVAALKSKNPMVRQGTLLFLARALAVTREQPTKSDLDAIAKAQVSQLGDSQGDVRAAAMDGLGYLMKIFGERAMNPYLEGVSEIQQGKIKESFEKAEVKCKGGQAKPAAKPAAKAASSRGGALQPSSTAVNRAPSDPQSISKPVARKPILSSMKRDAELPGSPVARAPTKVMNSPAIRSAPKFSMNDTLAGEEPSKSAPRPTARAPPIMKRATAPPKPAVTSKPTAKASATAGLPGPAASEPVKYKFSAEDAEAQAADLIPADIQAGLADGQWKERLGAAERLLAWVEEGNADKAETEVIFRYLCKTPGWNEKNFQVSGKIYSTMGAMAQKCAKFGRSSAALAIGPLTDKLGDLKLKKPAGEALGMFAEKTSLGFVFSQAFEPMTKQKAPKAQADALTWVKQAILEFGIAGLALKELVAFLKTGLQSANGAVRSSATSTLVTLRLYVGTDVTGFLEDLNPALLSTINSEFDKVTGQTPPEPTRQSVELQQSSVAGTASAGVARSGGADPLDDLIPRVDLDKLVGGTNVISDSKSDSWKTRKEAFESLLAVLEQKSNSRLKPNMGEIGTVLKNRLNDANLSVKILCLNIVSKIASAMGTAFQAHARVLATPVANVLADQKVTTRNAALATLGDMADAADGLDSLITGLATSLENNNPLLRSSVLGFVVAQLQQEPTEQMVDLSPLVSVTLSSVEDRSADVRKAAQALLPFLVSLIGFAEMSDRVGALKPASRNTIMPMIEKARSTITAPAKTALKAAPASAPPPSAPKASIRTSTLIKPIPATLASTTAPLPSSPRVKSSLAPVRATGMAMKASALRASSLKQPSDEMISTMPKPIARSRYSIARPSQPPSSDVYNNGEGHSTPTKRDPPFMAANMEPKAMRAKRDLAKWSFDTNSASQLLDYLQRQMEGHASQELMANLFSTDRLAEKDHMTGLATLDDFYACQGQQNEYDLAEDILDEIRLANMDLALKYVAIRLQEGSTQMILKCLDIVLHIIENVNKSEHGGFSEAEINVFLPALVRKLGDNKFKEKLSTIFAIIDRTVPSSKVLQFCVEYGVDSTNSKTRAASLEMLSQLIRKRGDIASSASAAKLYRRIAEQISSADSNTRNFALDCIAFLHKYSGTAALDYAHNLPQKERDMLQNRIEKLAGPKSTPPSALSSPPKQGDIGTETPSPSQLPRYTSSSRTPSHAEHTVKTTSLTGGPRDRPEVSRMPSEAQARSVRTQYSGLPRPRASTADLDTPPVSDLGPPPPPYKPVEVEVPIESADDIAQLIRIANTPDPQLCVKALKRVQIQLVETPNLFVGNVALLISTVTRQFERLFEQPATIDDPQMFRMAKHLIQTMSNFCDLPELLSEINSGLLEDLLEQLSRGLLLLTKEAHKEMAKFVNMTILRLFATSNQVVLFRALFDLLQKIALPLTPQSKQTDFAARHGELVLKCIWKRSRSAETDLKKGKLKAADLFRILEDFLGVIDPKNWKERSLAGVPLGDMPLRTIKVLIQHIFGVLGQRGCTEALSQEFGQGYTNIKLFTYVKRLFKESQPSVKEDDDLPVESAASDEKHAEPAIEALETAKPSLVEDELDARLQQLVTSASGVGSTRGEAMPELHNFLKQHPEKKEKFEAMLDLALGASKYKLFIKRKLQNLAEAGSTASPIIRATSESKQTDTVAGDEPAPIAPGTSAPRQSVSAQQPTIPQPPIPADADDDTKLAMYKDKLKYYALGTASGDSVSSS
ncbi:hypothetical protein NCC49_006149 [Naganishia albida]|nr:hypothetical protein NCC49_006149 [Naganishia albida]